MEVRVLAALPSSGYPEQDYIRVHTDADPLDDTVVLATIERVTDRSKGKVKRVKTLLARQRMPADAALDLATSYAEWKQVPVVYTDSWPPWCGKAANPFEISQWFLRHRADEPRFVRDEGDVNSDEAVQEQADADER